MLIGCAPQSRRPDSPLESLAVDQPVPDSWTFDARIAVSNGKDGGSGRLHWQQQGEFYTIIMRAPISGQSWQLSGDRSHARLEGVRPYPVLGTSAQEVLRRELGWELPVGDMMSWLFGTGFGKGALIQADSFGRPISVRDRAWQLSYRDWREVEGVQVPVRVTAKKPPYQVRLAIQHWNLPKHGGGGVQD